ncbi:SBBP repeat-containing protein [Hymenobacter chitinivorans]|uniref:Putative secreted protein (Por secretion system target) n=1 Tax=Hymenobacter chitinivorans DSM 11115 TaxID=1121954 RepID=A0A2M9AQA9_9BACT|nr:SBBP repeat-containing protein [Hymenobacter chitinivorans]PJJ47886.1 putative secreted protein (Por secretion system target) [Hymenobacter chitinivorans DSM 11115]
MKQLFLALALFACLTARAQPATWNWVRAVAGSNPIMALATDANGDFYITGNFTDRLQLGATELTNPGPCLYIAKLNAAGTVLRATTIPASLQVLPTGLALDALGNCYLTGLFQGTLTYPGGSITSQSSYGQDVLVLKCSPAGRVQWARQISSTSQDRYGAGNAGWAIAVDQAGNSFVTGNVSGTTVQIGEQSFTNRQGQAFVASYSPQGAVRWAKVWNKPADYAFSQGRGAAVDAEGNCYVSGNFFGTLALDGTTVQPAGYDNSVFMARFDARNGQLRWLQAPNGNGDGKCLATDRAGKIYVANGFSGTATLGGTTLTSTGDNDIYVARYNRQGQAEWATRLGGANYDFPTNIAVDKHSGSTYLTGSESITTAYQGFIAQLLPNGKLKSTDLVGGPGTSTGTVLALDGHNTVYTCGILTGSCQFGARTITTEFTETYLARFGPSGTGNPGCVAARLESSVFPNPAQGRFTLRIQAPATDQSVKATLYNPFGRIVAQQTVRPGPGSTDATFDTAGLPSGLYVLNLEHNQQVTTQLVTVR